MRLEDVVMDNRFTISFVFPLIGGLTLLGSYEGILPELISFNSALILFGTLVMRMPLIAGLKPLLTRRLIAGISLLVAYTYIIEFIGVHTGFPYGSFSYGIELGPMILDKIPLALPIFFIPLVINSYLLILLLKPEKSKESLFRLFAVISTVLLLDMILDPAAVAINFWNYGSGFYYGVPISNYLGWLLSATISVIILDNSVAREKMIERLESCKFMLDDMLSFALLWGLINLYFGQMIPFTLSLMLLYGLFRVNRFDFVKPENPIRKLEKLRNIALS